MKNATPPLRQWSSELIRGAFQDLQALACVLLCPCVVFARNAKSLTDGQTPFFRACLTYSALGGCWGCIGCYLCGPLAYSISCVPCYASKYRTQMRARRGLPDVPVSDKQAHLFCHPCALCQEFREIKSWHDDIVIGPSEANVDRDPNETITYLQNIQDMKR